jgi:uncharacterized protein YacL
MGNMILGVVGFVLLMIGAIIGLLTVSGLTSPDILSNSLPMFQNYIIGLFVALFFIVVGAILFLISLISSRQVYFLYLKRLARCSIHD